MRRKLPPKAARAIGQNIRNACERAGLGQNELAGLICQDRALLSRWISGEHVPGTYWILEICKHTQSLPGDLLGDMNDWEDWYD